MFTQAFWKATVERLVKTIAQTAVAVLTATEVFDLFSVDDWQDIAKVSLVAGLGSLLTSLAATSLTDIPGPSFVPKAEVEATGVTVTPPPGDGE